MGEYDHQKDPGAVPFVTDMTVRACRNRNFRETVWTGNHLQLTVMEIPLCGEEAVLCLCAAPSSPGHDSQNKGRGGGIESYD